MPVNFRGFLHQSGSSDGSELEPNLEPVLSVVATKGTDSIPKNWCYNTNFLLDKNKG